MEEKWSRHLAFILVTLLLFSTVSSPVQAAETFADLKGHWVEAKVKDLVAAGIISPGDKFRPREPVTRADFIKMLVLATGLPQAVSYPPTFSDVRQEHWFYKYVETAAYHGVIKGDASGKFRPFDGLTREQMASMVVRALKDETEAGSSFLAKFKDGTQVSAWAKQDVARAVAKGFISGTDQGFLFPTQAATRDQAAAVIWEVWKKRGSQEQTPVEPPGTDTLSATVKTTSLTTVVLTFNRSVNTVSASRTNRYRLVPATGLQVEIPIEAVQVAADGRSVTLSTGLLTSGTRYLLTVLDIEAGDKTHTLSLYFTADKEMADPGVPPISSPTADKVVAVGPTCLQVTFEQDLDPASVKGGPEGSFTLVFAGTAFSPGIVTEAVVTGPRQVTLTVPELEENERYTLSAHDLKNTMGQKLSAEPISFSFTVRAPQQAPQLVALECTGPDSLVLTFDRELDEKSATSLSAYRLRETGEQPQQVWVAGKKVVLVFADGFTTGASYTLEIGSLTDGWGNRSVATSRRIVAQKDSVPPVALSSKALSSTAVEVIFNEKLSAIGDISLRRQGRKVDIRRAEQVAPGRVIITTQLDRDDNYQLELVGALDKAGNKGVAQSLYFTFVSGIGGESTGFLPEVKQVKMVPGRSDQLLVQFSQPVRSASAEKTRNYQLTLADDLSAAVDINLAEMGSSDKEVVLSLAEPLEVGWTYRYFISGVEGMSGDEIIPAAGYVVPGSSNQENGFVRSVTIVDSRQLEVVFNEDVDVKEKYRTSNYGLVDQKNSRVVPILGVDATTDSYRVILRLGQDLEEERDYLFSAGNNLADITGRRFPTFSTTIRLAERTSSGRLRFIESQALDSRSFRLTFTRPVQEVKVDLPGYIFDYEYYGSVVLVRANKNFKNDERYRPEVWARDNSGQVLEWRSFSLRFDTTSQVAEVVDVAAATSQRVKVEFSAPLDPYSAGDELNYYLETSSQAILRPVKAEYDPARLMVWLTLPPTTPLAEEKYYLLLDGVKDANGNRLSTKERYRFYGVDTVPPVVVLPDLVNQEGLPVRVVKSSDQVTVEGIAGAVEPEAYLRIYVDDQLIMVAQAGADGSFKPLGLGQLKGRHSLRLVVTDLAGNSGERSQTYEF